MELNNIAPKNLKCSQIYDEKDKIYGSAFHVNKRLTLCTSLFQFKIKKYILFLLCVGFILTGGKWLLIEMTKEISPLKCKCSYLSSDPASLQANNCLNGLDPFYNSSSWDTIEKHHPNFPVFLLRNNKERCNLFPHVFSVKWSGVHWQEMRGVNDETFLLYSAFYDKRSGDENILILALVNDPMNSFFPKFPWCHLWYEEEDEPTVSRVTKFDYIDWQWRSSDRLMSFLITCPIAPRSDNTIPIAVSLVAAPCSPASNLLKVFGNNSSHEQTVSRQKKGNSQYKVGVCGPALYYYQQDISTNLVEWMELMKEIGASQVFLYSTGGVHPNIQKVFQHYQSEGYLTLTDFHYPPPYVDDHPLRRLWTETERKKMFSLENIYFSDCILRNKDDYRFLVHIDPDELPILLKHDSLPDLVENLSQLTSDWLLKPPGYNLFWEHFPIDVPGKIKLPQHFHILNHDRIFLNIDSSRHNIKTIYDTRYSSAAISHRTIVCVTKWCNYSHQIYTEVAFMGHFRHKCGESCVQNPNETREVPLMHKYVHSIRNKVENTLHSLKLIDKVEETFGDETRSQV